MIYKKTVEQSTRKNKKYMIMNDDHNFIHFGDLRYEDFTKHQDFKRLNNYLSRATKIKGNWKITHTSGWIKPFDIFIIPYFCW